jgi:hypothetical protein
MLAEISKIFNGKSYNSFTELCFDHNLSDGCVRARLKRGWSINEALGIIYRKNESGGRDKEIEVDGVKYKSIKIACKSLKIKDYDNVYQRLKNENYTVKQAFGIDPPPKKKSSIAIKITIGKKTFESKRAAAIFHKIDERIISNRIKRGWTIEEAYELKNRLPDKNKIFLKSGKKRQGYIYLISNKFNEKEYVGITIGSIKERFNSHLYEAGKKSNKDSLEYAIWIYGSDQFTYKKLKKATVDKMGSLERYYIKKLKTKVPNGYNINSGGAGVFGGVNYKIPIILDDEIFFSLSDVSRYLNVRVATISARIRSGWDIKKAITKKIRSIKKVKFNNVEYESINHASRALGLKVSTISGRIKSGWTARKALTKKIKDKKNLHLLPYHVNKKKFDNFADLARSMKIKPSTFTARLRAGKTINDALKIKVKSKKININGIEFKNFKEATKHFNVDYNLALQRINRDKFSIKKALEIN